MKIELKRVTIGKRTRGDNESLEALLYINQVKAGFAFREGREHGLIINPLHEKGAGLIIEAENWCRKQPAIKPEKPDTHLVKGDGRNLITHINKLFADHKRELTSRIFSRQLLADQYRGLVVGYPDKGYRIVDVPGNPVGQLIKTDAGRTQIEKMLEERIKPLLKEGAQLLNTNLPLAMLSRLGIASVQQQAVQQTGHQQTRNQRQRIQ